MPRFRPDLREIRPYTPGRSIETVAAQNGFDPSEIVKLASNENPLPPLPEVAARIRELAAGVNRYPDNDAVDLRSAIGDGAGVGADHVWIGGGSSELLRVIALAVGGPGTTALYPWPSFVIYRLGAKLAMSERIEVPLTAHRHDLDAMASAVRQDTTVVYLCNPNNPTGTHLPADDIARFVDRVPDDVLVVIDEAYHEFVTAADHRTAIPLAVERPNVLVTRTFSKIHGLASLRVGYGVSRPETITELRKAQAPFTVSSLGQAAAVESLRHVEALTARAAANAVGRASIESALAAMGVDLVPSQGNFVFFDARSVADVGDAFLSYGVIVRVFGGWVRATVGTDAENARLVEAARSLLRA